MLSSVVNWYGSEPVWRTSARFFASLNELRPVICALPLMPFDERAVVRVDLRERLDLAVEDDREVLRRAEEVAAPVEAAT